MFQRLAPRSYRAVVPVRGFWNTIRVMMKGQPVQCVIEYNPDEPACVRNRNPEFSFLFSF